jgi:predicted alpha/beta-hydrolase family hydrolase
MQADRSSMPERLVVEISERERTSALAYRADQEQRLNVTLVLAHGAGAGQDQRFMVEFARGLASRGVDVMTFNFLYTEQRRRIPDRTEKLESCYRAAIAAARSYAPFGGGAIFIGGKSMGGRIATHLAAAAGDDAPAAGINGLVLLGYPLHPPGKPDQPRTAHLAKIRVPMLIVQGSRDPFGTPDELRPVLDGLAADVTLQVVENGDHSLAPPKRGAVSAEQTYGELQDVISRWIRHRRMR